MEGATGQGAEAQSSAAAWVTTALNSGSPGGSGEGLPSGQRVPEAQYRAAPRGTGWFRVTATYGA